MFESVSRMTWKRKAQAQVSARWLYPSATALCGLAYRAEPLRLSKRRPFDITDNHTYQQHYCLSPQPHCLAFGPGIWGDFPPPILTLTDSTLRLRITFPNTDYTAAPSPRPFSNLEPPMLMRNNYFTILAGYYVVMSSVCLSLPAICPVVVG